MYERRKKGEKKEGRGMRECERERKGESENCEKKKGKARDWPGSKNSRGRIMEFAARCARI